MSINLLNVKDIVTAVKIIVDKNIKPGKYNVTNNKNVKLYNLVKKIKKEKKFKSSIKFEKNPFRKEKFSIIKNYQDGNQVIVILKN